jgi:hypothetical protein
VGGRLGYAEAIRTRTREPPTRSAGRAPNTPPLTDTPAENPVAHVSEHGAQAVEQHLEIAAW